MPSKSHTDLQKLWDTTGPVINTGLLHARCRTLIGNVGVALRPLLVNVERRGHCQRGGGGFGKGDKRAFVSLHGHTHHCNDVKTRCVCEARRNSGLPRGAQGVGVRGDSVEPVSRRAMQGHQEEESGGQDMHRSEI